MSPRPFRIDVPQAVLTDLHWRLDATRFPEPLPGAPWERGADVSYVRELCAYWRHQYDWRQHEAELNRFPQFLCEVDGVDLHFWHVRGRGPSPLPLLLTHGWPGSIHEFHHLIGPLTDPAAHGGDASDAFDVVIPALPGYGFSGKPREPGWHASRVAAAFDRLMVEHLGYPRYGAQGGDWGGLVTTALGVEHAEHLVGIHLNLAFAEPPPGEEQSPLSHAHGQKMAAILATETGVPTAVAVFPKEIPLPPRRWLEARYNLRRYTEMARGGHFAAVDAPELFLEDVRALFRELRGLS